MHIRHLGTELEIDAPAKINLFLEVLGKRADGYHEIETLLVAVTVYDTVVFIPRSDGEIELACQWAGGFTARDNALRKDPSLGDQPIAGEIPVGRENLVWRAAMLLRERAGCHRGATIKLLKRIPAAAGLGGASSDAAATLVAANAAWQLGWTRERLAELAAELGSDVPFFLTRGAAVCRGRGECIEPLAPLRLHLVIVRPPIGLSTPRVYKECQPTAAPRGAGLLVTALTRGDPTGVARQLGNDLARPAAKLTSWIQRLQEEFERQGVLGYQMSGSGSSYFGLCRSARHSRRIAARLRSRRVGAVFCTTTAAAN